MDNNKLNIMTATIVYTSGDHKYIKALNAKSLLLKLIKVGMEIDAIDIILIQMRSGYTEIKGNKIKIETA